MKITENRLSGRQLEEEALRVLRTLLGEVGLVFEFARTPSTQDGGVDFIGYGKTALGRLKILIEVRSRLERHDIHRITYYTSLEEEALPLLIAPYVSPSVMEACRESGVSWMDLAGNCDIRFDGLLLRVSGRANPYAQTRRTKSLFAPRSARVCHALLLEPNHEWKTEELAERAGISLGLVSNARKLLEATGWVEIAYGRLRLTEPKSLLDEWQARYQPVRSERRFFTTEPIPRFEKQVASVLHNYAFTEFSAADRYAPYTRYQRSAFYLPSFVALEEAKLGLRGGEGATNVTVYASEDASCFVEIVDGVRCASPIQTYLDLRLLTGRGSDAADVLFETAILPRWE